MGVRGERMQTFRRWVLASAVLWSGGGAGFAQVSLPVQGLISKSEAGPAARVRILREIQDPNTGVRWMVIANMENPAGPGRLVPAEAAEMEARAAVIHSGDRVVVEEHTVAADVYLEAKALEPASIGSRFAVRLKVGGKVLKAVAVGPGKAVLDSPMVQDGRRRP